MRKCIIFLILSIFSIFVFGQETTQVNQAEINSFPIPKVDKRVELLSIVFRLAGNREYNDENYQVYINDIHKHFDKYQGHELIAFATQLRNKNGVAYDAVMKMAIYIEQPPSLNPIVDFTSDIPEGRWGQENATRFVKLLQQFYVDAKCDEFFKAHEELYKNIPKRFKKVYDALDINWYNQYYGVQPKGSLNIILGLGNGGGNYGPKVILPDGQEDSYAIIGTWPLDSLGEPEYNVNDNLPTLIHEFNHSYVNHLTNINMSKFEASGVKLFDIVRESMEKQSYGNWQIMMNEALVRASVIRYYLSHNSNSAVAKTEMIRQFNKGFFWIKELVDCLGEYENKRDKYPTLESYMPVLIDFYNRIAKNTESMFEIKN